VYSKVSFQIFSSILFAFEALFLKQLFGLNMIFQKNTIKVVW